MKKIMLLSIVLLAALNANAAFSGSIPASVPASVSITPSPSPFERERNTLVEKLKSGVIETLYYTDIDLKQPLKDLIDSKDNEELLVSAYRMLDDDAVNLKHTILIVMIKKQQRDTCSEDSLEKMKGVLVSALADDHFWIRTEAAWGLRYFGDASLMRRVAPLVEDKSDFVRKEARATMLELYETYQDRTDNTF